MWVCNCCSSHILALPIHWIEVLYEIAISMFNIISLHITLLPILWLPDDVRVMCIWNPFFRLHCIALIIRYTFVCCYSNFHAIEIIPNKSLLTLELYSLLIPNELTLIDMFIMKLTKIGFHVINMPMMCIPYHRISIWCLLLIDLESLKSIEIHLSLCCYNITSSQCILYTRAHVWWLNEN